MWRGVIEASIETGSTETATLVRPHCACPAPQCACVDSGAECPCACSIGVPCSFCGAGAVIAPPAQQADHEVDFESEAELEPDPYWESLGERGEGAWLLHEAGLPKKAYRFADCETRAEKAICFDRPDEHKFFNRYHCMNRFCSYCGPLHRARLHEHYAPLLAAFLRNAESPQQSTLARLNFTFRCNGEAPTRDEIRGFNEAVRQTVKRAIRRILKIRAAKGDEWAKEALKSRKPTYGFLFVDEVGYETRGHIPDELRVAHGLNLHCHVLFYGPFLTDWSAAWEVFRDTWRQETEKRFGEESHGCWITHLRRWRSNPVREVRHALNHLLKYVSKVPYETQGRMAQLEKAFDGARRVHTGGLWYRLPKEPEHAHGPGYCPVCASEGRRSPLQLYRRFLPSGGEIPDYWPVKALEKEGYRDLEKVRREVADMILGTADLWEFRGG